MIANRDRQPESPDHQPVSSSTGNQLHIGPMAGILGAMVRSPAKVAASDRKGASVLYWPLATDLTRHGGAASPHPRPSAD